MIFASHQDFLSESFEKSYRSPENEAKINRANRSFALQIQKTYEACKNDSKNDDERKKCDYTFVPVLVIVNRSFKQVDSNN
jgi:hypothetical protein